MRLRIDETRIDWPSYVDLESAVHRLVSGKARMAELSANRFTSLVGLRAPDGEILLELVLQPAGKRPQYISYLSRPLDPADLAAAFAAFHDGRLEELWVRFRWQSTTPRLARPDHGLLWWVLWLALPQLLPLIDVLFQTKRR